jgi:hypothetical protein
LLRFNTEFDLIKLNSNFNSSHFVLNNKYGLKHVELFRIVYVAIFDNLEISNNLIQQISLKGTYYPNNRFGPPTLIEIHPGLKLNKLTTFDEFYAQIYSEFHFYGASDSLANLFFSEIFIRVNYKS